ncbi:hypothetical protein DYI37_10395 [Fulvimarina endophytica]|uniref:Polysaccharide export protein N-terminal domain-containing protein n=1 Tax=Fulvimarina endophytica TaxID=2293836 RepID=A0A371X2I1_9HYPH|nr:polysaccharide biosynthesis/export family protein [Fulvimarina endophytica]RFC63438.1 hypothetical protein DYI37_10395 [Fulvimarina endophytica]
MKRFAFLSAVAAACVLAAPGLALMPQAHAQTAASSSESASEGEGEGRAAEAGVAYHIGDTVKISFFEQLASGTVPGDEGAPAAYYQRLDLTGDYRVQEDGTVDIPRLGSIPFAGRDRAAVRDDILAAYEDAIGQSGDVHVAVVSSQPIYVLGPVGTPGQFAYSSGLIVIQAIALAGGLGEDRVPNVSRLEGEREAERADGAMSRLASLLARRERLDAESSGQPLDIPSELTVLVGPANAAEMIERERAAQGSSDEAREQAIGSYRDLIAGLERERAELSRSAQEAMDRAQSGRADLSRIEQPDPRLTDETEAREYRTIIAQSEQRHDDLQRELQRLSREIDAYRNASDKVDVDYAARLRQDLLQVNDEIALARAAMKGASRMSLSSDPAETRKALSDFRIEIVRRDSEGTRTFEAEPTTELYPGDVVNLEPRSEESAMRVGSDAASR